MEKLIAWAKSHPWLAGGSAVAGIVLFFILMRSGGSASSESSGPNANLAAYLAAETAQTQYGDALAAAQSQYENSTLQAGIAANEQIAINNTWAASDLATTESNNQTSISNNLISGLSAIANNLGTVLTNSTYSGSQSQSSSGGSSFLWGLFGSGPSSSGSISQSGSSSQSFVANSQQAAAEHELEQIANSNFHIGN